MQSLSFLSEKLKRIACVILMLALAVCVSLGAQAKSTDDPTAGQKHETELRLGLSERGFNHLLQRWEAQAERSHRSDVYFDVFESGQFLIRRNEPRAKLRLQNRHDEIVSQKSWILEQQILSSCNFEWSATTRASSSERFSRKGSTHSRLESTIKHLPSATYFAVDSESLLHKLQKVWSDQRWPALPAYDQGTEHLRGPVGPAAVVHKERWVVSVPLDDGKIYKLQLGRDSDVVSKTAPVSFELEVEIKFSSIAEEHETVRMLTGHLVKLGLTPAHTSPAKTYDFFHVLENLYSKI